MHRFAYVLLLVLALLLPSPAAAIMNGEPDTASPHHNVGYTLVKKSGSPDLLFWCSGTLIAPDVFLTASHCTDWLDIWLARGEAEKIYVTFDPQADPDPAANTRLFEVDLVVTHPNYTWWGRRSDDHDIAVLILSERVPDRYPDIQPAGLPSAGLLDDLQVKGGLHGQHFTVVGYGASYRENGHGPPRFPGEGERRVAVSEYRALNRARVHLSQNPSHDLGGSCFGDSGGPSFLGDTDIIAGIIIDGDQSCRATNILYRVDTESARSFLEPFVDLP